MEIEGEQNSKEDARYYRAKHILETLGESKVKGNGFNNLAVLGISENDYNRWLTEKEGGKQIIFDAPASRIFTLKDQAQHFIEKQPLFYDKAGNFWIWNFEEFRWGMIDSTDVLRIISNSIGLDTISTKTKTEIIEALKQVGRGFVPKEIEPTWIQFKDTIFDVKTGVEFKASPEYFATNPIPYQMHPQKLIETPVMDKIFEEWVGKAYVKTLYQILAYCLIPSYPINRLFCFIGSGMNGKSKFLELLTKFVGNYNCTSTELDTLIKSRFEVTRLHKKLVCQMGETNFNELSQTSILKKLTGGDMIGFEYKNKTPFEDLNYAKILISTNNLPTTTDKSIGFYRRWMIVDFPNQFSEKKDILKDIPEEEYEILAIKCAFLLNDLLKERKFHNEGSVDDRMERYEAKSDFLKHFIAENIEESFEGFITSNDFSKKFNAWCKENRHREVSPQTVAKKLRLLGYEDGKKHFDWMYDGKGGQARGFYGIKWK